MKSWFKTIFIAWLFNISALEAQVGLNTDHLPAFSQHPLTSSQSVFNSGHSVFYSRIFYSKHPQGTVFNANSPTPFPKTYAYHDLAFFCKIEVKLERATSFPVKIRLGDVNYVDQLEGK